MIPLAAGWMIAMIRLVQLYRSARHTPRCCEECGFKMVRMGRGERFLTKAQVIEEKLQSREYDLWVCTCGHRELFVYAGKRSTVFQKCTTCSVTAMYGVRQVATVDGIYLDTHCAACDTKVDVANFK